ncbi:cysteine synthase family protein [bacterium]|nr:cysteine synthase family protein [bacterium]
MSIRNKFKGILGSIGNTPLMRLEFDVKPTILAKLEMLNPGGSLKDRTALHMVEVAEKTGRLKPGGTIVEASSGSQGISLAMVGKVKGYRVIITVPDRTAPEKIAVLRAYGAEVYVCPNTDRHDDPRNYHTFAEHLVRTIPGAFMPDQYFNKENPRAHYLSTGPEIWQQTEGKITHFVCGVGSCGMMSGAGRYLKDQNPAINVIGVDAATSMYSSKEPKAYKVEGLGIDVITDTFDQTAFNQIVPITDEDAFAMTKRLAMEHGLLVGISTGAVMHVALEEAKKLSEDDVMVVIFGDSGRNYLSKVFADEVKNVKNVETALEHGVVYVPAE